MSLLDAAIRYVSLGLRPFALRPQAKIPATEHGCLDASDDVAALRAQWQGVPDRNVGLATGALSGVLVLDVDGPEGSASLAALEARHGALGATPEVATARGRHLYFAYPGDQVEIRNSAGKLGAGLDIRTDGGYVVAPPSVHPDGSVYAWLDDRRIDSVPLAPLPDWMIAALTARPAPLPPLPPTTHNWQGNTRYGSRALDGECDELARSGEGQRNQKLNEVAFRVGQLVAAGHLGESSAVAAVTSAAHACGLEDREIRSTLASGFSAGQKSPCMSDPNPSEGRALSRPAASLAPVAADGTAIVVADTGPIILTAQATAQTALDYLTDGKRAQMPRTGFPLLDRAVGGFPPGTMTTIGGRTGAGKSSLLLGIALNQSKHGLKVGIVSCEDSEWIWGARIIAERRCINPERFFESPPNEEMVGQAVLGVRDAADIGVHFSFQIGKPISAVLAAVHRLVTRERCDVIMVDYLQAIAAKGQDRYTARTDAAQELKGLCHTHGVPLILASQLRRPENGSPFKEPTSTEMKDSGDIENMSEAIILLWTESDAENAPAMGKVAKLKWSDKRPKFMLARHPTSGALVSLLEPMAPAVVEPVRSSGGFYALR